MSYRLKDRQRQIPNGYVYLQAATNWKSPFFASFNVIVSSLIAHRKANPHLVKQHGWRTDEAGVADEVDEYNARICAQNGWTQYIMAPVGEPPPPKSKPPTLQDQKQLSAAAAKVRKIWSGVKTLNDWIDSKEGPVPQEQANARAATCAKCPKNGKGDFTRWFTGPASEAIKRQMAKLDDRKLSTPDDANINVCEVCLCPLKLKVHTPLSYIRAHMTDDVFKELDAVGSVEGVAPCWQTAEMRQ